MKMIEKMASAIWDELRKPGDPFYCDLGPVAGEHLSAIARAALEAIREPSASVLSASGMLDAEGQGLAASMWRDMVQEIINEA